MTINILFARIQLALFLTLMLIGPPQFANASTILKQSFTDISQNAEYIFEGEVIRLDARASAVNGDPVTFVQFQIHDEIKGALGQSVIELSYAGGTLNGQVMKVSDLTMPEVGEHGVYFVESLSKRFAHPLYGWHQGHYVVENDSQGVQRVRPQQQVLSTAPGLRSNTLVSLPTIDSFKSSIRSELAK